MYVRPQTGFFQCISDSEMFDRRAAETYNETITNESCEFVICTGDMNE